MTQEAEAIKARWQSICSRIDNACHRSNRKPDQVSILAVSKLQPLNRVQAFLSVMTELGVKAKLGENYVQEFRDKRAELPKGFESHLIGPLQSNKVKEAVRLFDVIESVHNLKILNLVQQEAEKLKKHQTIFLQVNISRDLKKSGFFPDELGAALEEASRCSHVRVRGLMTITEFYRDPEQARPDYKMLRLLSEDILRSHGITQEPLELSMGMSDDFEVAVEEGANEVRLGTLLFGQRNESLR